MSDCGESAFYERIDAYVLNALRKCDDFNSLMKNNGGIHPIDLMNSLHRLYKCKEIHKSKYRRLVQSAGRKGQVAAEDMPNCLPVPHLLDYDWRFSRNGIENLARALRSSIQDSKATVAFIGTPSLFKHCVEALHKNTMLVLVDQNAEKHAAGIMSSRTKYINVDISGSCKALKRIYADFIVMDPPWYKIYYELFFDRAMLMAQMDSCIVCVMPPSFTRATADKEKEQLLKLLDNQYGLKKLHYYSGVVSYHTPPYEQNVLKANGICCIPANWRIGDILVVQKKGSGTRKKAVYLPSEESVLWDEVSIGPVRIKIRHEKDQFDTYNIKLDSIYPNDIYPSVKRSSRGKSVAINVWTSGNRVFRCSNPALLYFALLHHDENLSSAFTTHGFPAPEQEELLNIQKVVERINRIAHLECLEYGSNWEA